MTLEVSYVGLSMQMRAILHMFSTLRVGVFESLRVEIVCLLVLLAGVFIRYVVPGCFHLGALLPSRAAF